MNFYKKFLKRFFDIVLCSVALIVFLPVFVITSLAIKLSSPGPVFYSSNRAGLHKKAFHFYKFRSMHQTKKDKGMFITDEDRLFNVGKIIRRLKIDELPQLINVIKGDMSIVGPRPMIATTVEQIYKGRYEKVTEVRPGITSAASLYDYTVGDAYIDDKAYIREVLPIKLEMELYYIEHESFKYDIQLIWRTMLTILQVIFKKKQFSPQPEYLAITNEREW